MLFLPLLSLMLLSQPAVRVLACALHRPRSDDVVQRRRLGPRDSQSGRCGEAFQGQTCTTTGTTNQCCSQSGWYDMVDFRTYVFVHAYICQWMLTMTLLKVRGINRPLRFEPMTLTHRNYWRLTEVICSQGPVVRAPSEWVASFFLAPRSGQCRLMPGYNISDMRSCSYSIRNWSSAGTGKCAIW